jgi:soluble lytic murein transglycosylase-like protein
MTTRGWRRVLSLAAALLAPHAVDAQRAPATPPPVSPTRPSVAGVGRAIARAAAERERQRATAEYDEIFRKYTKRYFGVATDWRWFKAQGMAESDLIPTARSRVGARGIMQLMPTTYAAIVSQERQFRAIDDPEWNIAAGIAHDRYLWTLWQGRVHDENERWDFMFGSYNAGQGTIMRAQRVADTRKLDRSCWESIERVAPQVPRWRHGETLHYVKRIRENKRVLQDR